MALQEFRQSEAEESILEIDLEQVSDRTYTDRSPPMPDFRSAVNAAIQRGLKCNLLVKFDAHAGPRPIASALLEFIEHSIHYVFSNGSRAEGDRDENL